MVMVKGRAPAERGRRGRSRQERDDEIWAGKASCCGGSCGPAVNSGSRWTTLRGRSSARGLPCAVACAAVSWPTKLSSCLSFWLYCTLNSAFGGVQLAEHSSIHGKCQKLPRLVDPEGVGHRSSFYRANHSRTQLHYRIGLRGPHVALLACTQAQEHNLGS